MASSCCYGNHQPLCSFFHLSRVYNSWNDHFFTTVGPPPGFPWQRVYYSQMPDWELELMRKRYPEKPEFLIEHIRRDRGHLEGSSREMALLDKYPDLLPFIKRDSILDLPENSPWSSQNYAQRAGGRYSVHERAASGNQPGGGPQKVDNGTSQGVWLAQRRPSVSSASFSRGRSNAVDEVPAGEAPSTPNARLYSFTKIDNTPKTNGHQPRMPERAILTGTSQAIMDWWAEMRSSLLQEIEPPESTASPRVPSASSILSPDLLTGSRADHDVSGALQNPPGLPVPPVQLSAEMEPAEREQDARRVRRRRGTAASSVAPRRAAASRRPRDVLRRRQLWQARRREM
ncbi:hypothetical protein LZ554_005981 [Drepanopeziza brunnea f. sp. 'monogermtubi']|nr:hypothetical protein LZ554_005981 [Drepanopeziza brunnea f. sp. 'monogermtubi']